MFMCGTKSSDNDITILKTKSTHLIKRDNILSEKSILQVLAQSHALEVLRALNKKPMRFVDLKDVCNSNRTRSARLRSLLEKGLIRMKPKMIGRRAYTFYEINHVGKEALNLAEKLIQLRGTKE